MQFSPTGLGDRIFKERYAIHEGESWSEASLRIATSISADENKQVEWQNTFYNEINSGKFMPGGRVWYGAGRKTQQMLNCFVVPTSDSIEGWSRTVGDIMKISSLGGGVGINFSPIRSRGSSISRGGASTGAVSLMEICNSVGDVIRGGGGRRVAMMHCLSMTHKDASEFVDKKLNLNALNNANISVIFPKGASYEELNSNLFQTLVENAWKSGEPGLLNQRRAEEMSNVSYSHPLTATNPCGEIWLPDYGCCCLGALVLPRFVSEGQLQWHTLDQSVRTAVRFLDNVLDVNEYPLPEIEKMCRLERRIGLGVMGLHTMLLDTGHTYRDVHFVNQVMSFIRRVAYRASQELAREKGPFPLFNSEMFNSGFFTAHKDLIRAPMRNSAVLTVAPTGTTSMVHQVSSGIEPVFAARYIRRRFKGEGSVRTLVMTKEFMDYGDKVHGAYDLSPREHLQVQEVVQRHVDNAVSKTINLPAAYPVERLNGIIHEFLPVLKGTTFYRATSRGDEPLEYVPNGKSVSSEQYDEIEYEVETENDGCESGVCAL